MARAFAQAETINFAEIDDIVMHIKKITDFLGADVCIDAVGAEADGSFLQVLTSSKLKLRGGSPVALNWAIDTVRKAGDVSVVGGYGPLFSAVKFGDAMNKGLTIRTNQCSVKRHRPRLFEHVKNGVLKPSAIVTHRIPLKRSRMATTCFRASSIIALNRWWFRKYIKEGAIHGVDGRKTSHSARFGRATKQNSRLGRGPRPEGSTDCS